MTRNQQVFNSGILKPNNIYCVINLQKKETNLFYQNDIVKMCEDYIYGIIKKFFNNQLKVK